LPLLPFKVNDQRLTGVSEDSVVGRWTVKVLPKVDRLSGDRGIWEQVLIRMLRLTYGFPPQTTSETQLRVLPNSILNLYIELFISECEILTHQGLAKTWQRRTDNRPVMKGRLKVSDEYRPPDGS